MPAVSTIYDPVMNALLLYLQNATNYFSPGQQVFQYMARGVVMWEQLSQTRPNTTVPLIRQPALFLYDGMGLGGGTQSYTRQGRAQPAIRTIQRTIVIYAHARAPASQPGADLGQKLPLISGGGALFHPLIEAVETALAVPDNPATGTLTLGGLVAYCRIEGKGHLIPPDIDDNGQGMATLPVEIRIP